MANKKPKVNEDIHKKDWHDQSVIEPVGWKSIREELLALHAGQPQECRVIEMALREAEASLAALARLGHFYHLEAGPWPEKEAWPKTYFHTVAAPQGRLVRSPWELAELGDGWFPTLEEAERHEGMKRQFEGRGGVRQRNLPVLPSLFEKTRLDKERDDGGSDQG